MTTRSIYRNNFACTVVELILTLAIITLLLSLLIPTLSSTRRVAWAAQCQSRQRAIGVASLTYSIEAKGYFSLAQFMNDPSPAPGDTQEALWPITGRYEHYMDINPGNRSWYGPFLCPTYTNDGQQPKAISPTPIPLNTSYTVNRSLGQYFRNYGDSEAQTWLRNPVRINQMRNPAAAVWLIDGVYRNNQQTLNCGDPEVIRYGPFFWPLDRHPNGINNLLFADGHVTALAGLEVDQRAIELWSLGHK